MRYLYIFLFFVLYSCNNQRELQLPEIQNAKVTEVFDVSPAYIFYDETQPDSTLFNRTNLIGTTNWLVNIDKRLTLKQAISHIQYLQNKRKKAGMHKNENAKNYFTCNATSIKNLGFLEFTDVEFINDQEKKFTNTEDICFINFKSLNNVAPSLAIDVNFQFSKDSFEKLLNLIYEEYTKAVKIVLTFNDSMSFQDYITVKSELSSFKNIISNDEVFFNSNLLN